MPRRRNWFIGDQVVTSADVRRWMQPVAHRITKANWPRYAENYQVPQKIARLKAAGQLEAVISEAARDAGVAVRAARTPGTSARVRLLCAANEPAFSAPELHAQATHAQEVPVKRDERQALVNR